jgi:hypothetical protein
MRAAWSCYLSSLLAWPQYHTIARAPRKPIKSFICFDTELIDAVKRSAQHVVTMREGETFRLLIALSRGVKAS